MKIFIWEISMWNSSSCRPYLFCVVHTNAVPMYTLYKKVIVWVCACVSWWIFVVVIFLRWNSRLNRIKVCRGFASLPFSFFLFKSCPYFDRMKLFVPDYKFVLCLLSFEGFSYPYLCTQTQTQTKCIIWHAFSFHAVCVQPSLLPSKAGERARTFVFLCCTMCVCA